VKKWKLSKHGNNVRNAGVHRYPSIFAYGYRWTLKTDYGGVMHICPYCGHGHFSSMDTQSIMTEGFHGKSHVHCGGCRKYFVIYPRVIVTRHAGLVEHLRNIRMYCPGIDVVLEHATPEDIRGCDVIGVLPLNLAVHARSVTEIPLSLTKEDRGQELSVDRVEEIAGSPQTYCIFKENQLDGDNFPILDDGSVVQNGTGMLVFRKS